MTQKYRVNDFWYMKRAFKSLIENERVMIAAIGKKGRRTVVDVLDLNQNVVTGVSCKMLRKRPR